MEKALTKVIDTLTQKDFHEVIGTVQQVHCSRRRLLRRGLEFHECTINKIAHTKKSKNLFKDPCMLFFYKESFGTKESVEADMPLKTET